jgi:3-dehydroquinate dehydratase
MTAHMTERHHRAIAQQHGNVSKPVKRYGSKMAWESLTNRAFNCYCSDAAYTSWESPVAPGQLPTGGPSQ